MNLFGESNFEKEGPQILDRMLKNQGKTLDIVGDLVHILLHRCHSHIRPILAFQIFNQNKNFNFMAQVTTLTLTSTAPVTLSMTVVDANNNNAEIAGTLSGLTYSVSDASQDVAVVDPANPLEVDIHAVTNTGGTSVVGSGTFVSTLKDTNGNPAFSGTVTGTLVLVNNIPVAVLNPVLAFNQ